AHLTVDIGGRPGFDCGGFCSYCYFKNVKETEPFGCRYCLPFTKGCDYCTSSIREGYSRFRSLQEVSQETLANLQLVSGSLDRVTISGGGDPSCYPDFVDLIELLAHLEAPLHIGYTSGKGFSDPNIADFLINHNMAEVSFTVFSHRPELRARYMHDPSPEVSLEVFRRLAKAIDLYAAIIVLPGINDGDELIKTAKWIESCGSKGIILMRFANTKEQGLILNNSPIIKDQRIHTIEEFRDLVTAVKKACTIRVSGTPLYDADLFSPFLLLQEQDLLSRLPRITRKASVVTGSIAAPYISRIVDKCGPGYASVIPVRKEIADLITIDDLKDLDLSIVNETVIIPGRALIHEREATDILSGDGIQRTIVRGPDMLTADGETSMGMTEGEVLALELEGFRALIGIINQYGTG
ncbi:MAG: methyl coenzyme M reductase-arginine methyltransferase Mmp10, partial [Methanospirillaceae archaeon]|nr:methyl coenzyme M reductase-arginine methyltransferase Mmp10 [Methanospirillaceae archaeon]